MQYPGRGSDATLHLQISIHPGPPVARPPAAGGLPLHVARPRPGAPASPTDPRGPAGVSNPHVSGRRLSTGGHLTVIQAPAVPLTNSTSDESDFYDAAQGPPAAIPPAANPSAQLFTLSGTAAALTSIGVLSMGQAAAMGGGAGSGGATVVVTSHQPALPPRPAAAARLTTSAGLPEGWEERFDHDGRRYYANHHLRETQWDRPTLPANQSPSVRSGTAHRAGAARPPPTTTASSTLPRSATRSASAPAAAAATGTAAAPGPATQPRSGPFGGADLLRARSIGSSVGAGAGRRAAGPGPTAAGHLPAARPVASGDPNYHGPRALGDWRMYTDGHGLYYYHNFQTNVAKMSPPSVFRNHASGLGATNPSWPGSSTRTLASALGMVAEGGSAGAAARQPYTLDKYLAARQRPGAGPPLPARPPSAPASGAASASASSVTVAVDAALGPGPTAGSSSSMLAPAAGAQRSQQQQQQQQQQARPETGDTEEASAFSVAPAKQPQTDPAGAGPGPGAAAGATTPRHSSDLVDRFSVKHKALQRALNVIKNAAASAPDDGSAGSAASSSRRAAAAMASGSSSSSRRAAQRVQKFNIRVRRSRLLDDSYRAVIRADPQHLRRPLNVTFAGESALDYGGVQREWFAAVSKLAFSPDYGLFEYAKSGQYLLDVSRVSGVNPSHLEYFRFVGRLIGMAILHDKYLDAFFVTSFYKRLLGHSVALSDLESIDAEHYRSFNWMLSNPIEGVIYENFSAAYEYLGQVRRVELDIEVTDDNKHEYVEKYVAWRCAHGTEAQMTAILHGLHEVIPRSMLQAFEPSELELLIGGRDDIDLDDWFRNTIYKKYTPVDPQIVWFWEVIRSWDPSKRRKLLQFVTGSERVPATGFGDLVGSSGIRRFCIEKWDASHSGDSLPQSHTCFNRIDIPPYTSKAQLLEKLEVAIEHATSFGIQ
ncbi:hypothetical protein H696_02673 [Fonticula alba]|uniref:E3 ubiquitin-protein ligase n=1 Tax=Fonticula alba TaxID=691883 RepID=A0A058Z895_FONAL|nr:hypothetical protein H696_02673 [Fonticula alba]KCV70346.1 hypothetical protein H696_02673 [Fonticula alba]|eukprot:XP_009494862.1 hypothetical protein H696_02673 [Fonticula alba]